MKIDIEKIKLLSFIELQALIECSENITTMSFEKRYFIKAEVKKIIQVKVENLFIEE